MSNSIQEYAHAISILMYTQQQFYDRYIQVKCVDETRRNEKYMEHGYYAWLSSRAQEFNYIDFVEKQVPIKCVHASLSDERVCERVLCKSFVGAKHTNHEN